MKGKFAKYKLILRFTFLDHTKKTQSGYVLDLFLHVRFCCVLLHFLCVLNSFFPPPFFSPKVSWEVYLVVMGYLEFRYFPMRVFPSFFFFKKFPGRLSCCDVFFFY